MLLKYAPSGTESISTCTLRVHQRLFIWLWISLLHLSSLFFEEINELAAPTYCKIFYCHCEKQRQGPETNTVILTHLGHQFDDTVAY